LLRLAIGKKEETVIRALGKRAKISCRTFSNMLKLPILIAHIRIQEPEREGVIKGHRALDYEKTQRSISALFLVNISETVSGRGTYSK
jgi:DNA-binding Lrp family transcriptional regulator